MAAIILSILIAACSVLVCWNISSAYNALQSDIYELLYKIDLLIELEKGNK